MPEKVFKEFVCKEAEHDRPFKPANPSKKGAIKGTIDTFPEWQKDPTFLQKKRAESVDDGPPGFKCTYKYRSRPQPSVATNFRNLKASFPSAFRSPGK